MRVLAIETATHRGSVAVVEGRTALATASHTTPNAHGEKILPLIEQALAEVGWGSGTIDRVAVGVGPGSFTGVRVGIALAQGIAQGLDVPVIGVCSLEAMALSVPPAEPGTRWSLLDARRDEVFAAAYDAEGRERCAPRLVPRREVRALVSSPPTNVVVGAVAAELDLDAPMYRSASTDWPDAVSTAAIATNREPGAPVQPIYVRAADAVKPNLPPSPLS